MALPISAGEIYGVAKFAYELWRSCTAAKAEFDQIGKEVFAMRTVVELVHIECEDPESVINLVDNKEKSKRKKLGIYIGNCDQALKDVEALLKRYNKMSLLDRIQWSLSGHAEMSSLESNLSSFTTQLGSYMDTVAREGLKLINNNIGLLNKNLEAGIGRLEDLIEKYSGDVNAAVTEMMQQRQKCGASQKDRTRSQAVMMDYAIEVCRPKEEKQRPKTPDPPRGRHGNGLGVPPVQKRAVSVGTNSTNQASGKTGNKSPKFKASNKPNFTLECWLIQIKTAQALFVTLEMSEKVIQSRGQWKLREMAKQFNGSCETDRLNGGHDLVHWVLKDRRKKEENADYTWYPFAAKIERKSKVLLGMGIEEQAMVIIKRQLTPAAQKLVDEKAATNAKEAEKKKKAKEKAAKKKAVEAVLKKEKKERDAKIKALQKENAKIKAEMENPKREKAKPASADENFQVVDPTLKASKDAKSKVTKEQPKDPNQKATEKSFNPIDQAKKPESSKAKNEKKETKPGSTNKGKPGDASNSKAAASEVSSIAVETKNTKEKPAKKAKKRDSVKPETPDTSTSKDEKVTSVAEIQALKDENARLKAALEEAGSQI